MDLTNQGIYFLDKKYGTDKHIEQSDRIGHQKTSDSSTFDIFQPAKKFDNLGFFKWHTCGVSLFNYHFMDFLLKLS